MAVAAAPAPSPARWGRSLARWALPAGLAALLAVLTALPYLVAWSVEPPGRVFMGFFFLGDDANTYLAKMREGWDGQWLWTNRYSTEPGTGAWFFVFWIALGHLAALTHLSVMQMFQVARTAGAFVLLGSAWVLYGEVLPDPRQRRFAIVLTSVGLGMGYVVQALGQPYIAGQQSDSLDWRMPELSAFYSILALPHFAWVAGFMALGIAFTLRAVDRGSLLLGLAAGAAWLGVDSIHAQMPILLGGAFLVGMLVRPPRARGWIAFALAFALPAPYAAYSWWASAHVPEVVRWGLEWRNNLPPEGLSLALALAPQLFLAAWGLPGALRRRSRADVVLLAWLVLLAVVLWLPNPAENLRRRFFDGVYFPLLLLGARGLFENLLPRLRGRAAALFPFAFTSFAAIGSAFLLIAPVLVARAPQYALSTDEYSALAWLDGHPTGTVLATARLGLYVPAYSSDPTYVGQYSETFHYRQKGAEAYAVLGGGEDAAAFASAHGIRYLLWTPEVGGLPAGAGTPVLDLAGARIYDVGAVRT